MKSFLRKAAVISVGCISLCALMAGGAGRLDAAGVTVSVCSEDLWGDNLHCCTDHDANGTHSIDSWGEWMGIFGDPGCVDPYNPADDCNTIVNIGGDVNGQLNTCCNVINNGGTVSDSTILQACSNGGSAQSITTSSGESKMAPATLDECTVEPLNPGDMVDDKVVGLANGGKAVQFMVRYRPSEPFTALDIVKLNQTAGTAVDVEGTPNPTYGTAVSVSKELTRKVMTAADTQYSQVVMAPLPKDLRGEFSQKMEFDILRNDQVVAHCSSESFLQATGAGSGCSCDMESHRPSYPLTNLILAMSGLLPLGLMMGLRKRVVTPRV